MKKINLLFVIIIFLNQLPAFGQIEKNIFNANFKLSEKVKRKGTGVYTLGFDGKYNYTIGHKGFVFLLVPIGFKYVINRFDPKTSDVIYQKVPMKTDMYKLGVYQQPINIHLINKSLIQTGSLVNKQAGIRDIYLIEYSTSTLRQTNKLKIGAFQEEGRTVNIASVFTDPNNDQEFFVIVESEQGRGKKGLPNTEKNKASIFIIGDGLIPSFDVEVNINGSSKETTLKDHIITDNYIAFTSRIKGAKKEPNQCEFYLIDRASKNITQFEISLNNTGKNITDLKCLIDSEEKLYVSGFYNSNSKSNDVGGAFTQIYDTKSGQMLSEDIRPFGFELLAEKMSAKKKKKIEKNISEGKDYNDQYEYLVREVIKNNDGSSILVAECYLHYTTMDMDSKGRTSVRDHYIHADLITVRTNKEGQIEWIQRFKKYNHSSNPMAGEMLFHNAEKYFYVIFQEKLKLKIAEISKKDGKAKSKEVFSLGQIGNFSPNLGSSYKSSETSYISQFLRRRKAKLMTVSFKE